MDIPRTANQPPAAHGDTDAVPALADVPSAGARDLGEPIPPQLAGETGPARGDTPSVNRTAAPRNGERLTLSIASHWTGESWTGEIDAPPAQEDRLEHVFRYFNCVDPGDGDRLASIGYTLPPLSAWDVVVFHDDGHVYRCESVGWERIS